jgi:hypothetical protein
MNSNFVVKVEDAKLPDVQKALKAAGIKVRSIIEVYKEGAKKEEDKKEETAETNG